MLKKYLLKPKNTSSYFNKTNIFFSTIALILFILITYLVTTETIRDFEQNLLVVIKNSLPDWFIYVAKISYFLGEAEVTVFFVLFCLILLVIKKHWVEAQVVALSCLSVLILIDQVLKPWFDIRRPLDRLVPAITGYSYPSGHAAGNLLFYFLVAYIASRYFPQYQIYFYSLATFLILLMGISIAYLRVHWVSDVLASYCVGYILLNLSIVLLQSTVGELRIDN